jgi:hypothetical protein
MILEVYVLRGYVDIKHIDEESSRFAIYYSISQLKRNNLVIVVCYINYKIKGQKLMFKIVTHSK